MPRKQWGSSLEELKQELITAAARGGFQFKEWNKVGDEAVIKMLGYQWECKPDQLNLRAKLAVGGSNRGQTVGTELTKENVEDILMRSLTKRDILSLVAQIYDPLGLWSPLGVSMRITLSKILNRFKDEQGMTKK